MAIAFVILAPLIGFDAGVQPPSLSSLMLSGAMIVIMLGAVFAAVHHADVIAHRVGEPYGTLVLTLAVTVIEVALIESIVLTPGELARAGPRHRVCRHYDRLQRPGGLVRPVGRIASPRAGISGLRRQRVPQRTRRTFNSHTCASQLYGHTIGPYFSNAQLVFVSITTIILYVAFLFIQTSRHTNYFRAEDGNTQDGNHTYPSSRARSNQRRYALGGIVRSNPYREKICGNSGNRSFPYWRSTSRRGHHHRNRGIGA